ncbi:hypothetical protein GCM10027200_52180 [Lentzea nigeriaca]
MQAFAQLGETQLRSENARLLRLLELTPKQAAPPGPAQTGFFEAHPGPVDRQSAPDVKVDFFAALFAARTDIYATRWENTRTGKAGWLPAVRGGWRKGVRHEDPDHLPLDKDVLHTHLTGAAHVGLYPLLDGDLCWWLAADFDGQAAMLDALAYLKAARTWSVPAALEVSRSGVGAHAWVFFAAPVPAETARRLGTALLSLLGRMSPAEVSRGQPSRSSRRTSRRRREHQSAQRPGLDPDPGRRVSNRARPAQLRDPCGVRRADPRVARDAETRGVDAEPAVLRAPALANVHIGYTAVPAQLRRDPGRRTHPAAGPGGHGGVTGRAGRQPS